MTRRLLIGLCVAVLAMAAAVDTTKMPETAPLEAFELPPVHETKLDNGLRIVLVDDQRFPMMQVRLGFVAGDKFDQPEMLGLAEMAAELLKEGTESLSSREFAEALADIGGSLNASSNADRLMISGNALSENTGRLLELLADMARHANFPAEEIALRKQNRKQELAQQLSQPDVLADAKLRERLFGEHPYSRMLPTPKTIDAITREALLGFRDRFLVPNNAALVMVGPAGDRNALLSKIKARFGDWNKKAAPPAPKAKFPEPARSLTLVERPGSVQADVRAGRWAVNQADPDYFPLMLAHTIFGGGASSRMFNIIREEKGFGYDARSSLETRDTSGLFTAITQIRNEVAGEAVSAVLHEMTRMGTEAVTAEELAAAKNYRSGLFAVGLETPSGVANNLLFVKLRGLPDDYLEKYVGKVQAVTAAEVQAVSKKYMSPGKLSLVVVGDPKQIGEQLGKIGEWKIERTGE
ncbi:MAG: insulinase family protein [bacterium]|nr:insulinase family protein [bacterium]